MSKQGGSTAVTEAEAEAEVGAAGSDVAEGVVPDPVWVRPVPPDDMYVSLTEQLDNVRRWNSERGWGFGRDDFDGIDVTPTRHDDPFVVDVLAVYLPGDDELDEVRRTCDELWDVISSQHPNAWCWDEKAWDLSLVGRKQVRLLHGIVHQRGIRRVTLDLAAHWQPLKPVRSIDIRSRESAAAEVLAAAAHFPRWVRAMDGITVPFALLSGYQVTLVEPESWRRLPCLSWNESRETVSLTAHWADIYAPRWSSPVCLAGASVLTLDRSGSLTWAETTSADPPSAEAPAAMAPAEGPAAGDTNAT
jgi:hypothetical protein